MIKLMVHHFEVIYFEQFNALKTKYKLKIFFLELNRGSYGSIFPLI